MKCKVCDAPLPPRRRFYCSDRCKERVKWRKRSGTSLGDLNKVCQWCDTPFTAIYLRARFCSRKCYDAYYKVKDAKPKPCGICGTIFTPVKRATRKYCSEKCKHVAIQRARRPQEPDVSQAYKNDPALAAFMSRRQERKK